MKINEATIVIQEHKTHINGTKFGSFEHNFAVFLVNKIGKTAA